ncbi:MAG: primosomal protein N' [Bacteroidetes bacterium]|nr:primosomal protein N' [Bacteroidota bacterium]MBT3801144.1 primosomal protein N' [Bacteroidota bacterium]MBT4340358.1 primosomal protein N' [Bacteroidota bacterium]MBT5991649.1 primosomal protein N' [Bacteroidota bacterium]MBT7828312.1 primosomal protein N' [Bacteroidota bacterium]
MAKSENQNIHLFAEIILPFPLHKSFTYRIPLEFQDQVEIGKRVLVQFGKKKIYTGIVLEMHNLQPDTYKAKDLLDVLDEHAVVNDSQIKLWKWIAQYYCCSLGEVMNTALPASMKMESESRVILNYDFDGNIDYLHEYEKIIVESLRKQEELSVVELEQILQIKNAFPYLKSLYNQGVIFFREEVLTAYKPKLETVLELHQDFSTKEALKALFSTLSAAPKQLNLLLAYQQISQSFPLVIKRDVLNKAEVSTAIATALIKKGIFVEKKINIDRIETFIQEKEDFELKDFQQQAFDEIKLNQKSQDVVLLHGITSSGKTHVYLKLIEEIIEQGKQVLYLVPEIALSAQLIRKLRAYFGSEVGIYHSKFSANERYEIWHKTLNKEYKVVLGVRSALFLPFQNLGLVVVDEEHENTYKQQHPAPRYQARDTAIVLANLHGAKTILGSATPSFESYYNAAKKKFGLVTMNKRYSEVTPPEVLISNLAEDQKRKRLKGQLTSLLYEECVKTLEQGDQIILFINRRGYAPYLECQTCGWIPYCTNCDISMTYHKYSHRVNCHYCGSKQKVPNTCIQCGNSSMLMKGFGTEKVEDDIEIIFPDYQVMRMDMDTTRSKKAFDTMIRSFEKGEYQILIGTQMVTKGLDFEKVKLVGILNADQMLSFPDFRAVERSYQLMSQVSGRSGRREDRGRVVIQSMNPANKIFDFLKEHNYSGFFKEYLPERDEFNYPPFKKLIKLTLKNRDNNLLLEGSQLLGSRLKRIVGNKMLGPEAPLVSRIRSEYIQEIIIKLNRNNNIPQIKNEIMDELASFSFIPKYRRIKIIVDVDPF